MPAWFNKRDIIIAADLGLSGEAMNRVGQKTLASIKNRIHAGLTVEDVAAPPLKVKGKRGGYPAYKTKEGLQGIRDLSLSGRMMNSLVVLSANNGSFALGSNDDKLDMVLQMNQRISVQWGLSPKDREVMQQAVRAELNRNIGASEITKWLVTTAALLSAGYAAGHIAGMFTSDRELTKMPDRRNVTAMPPPPANAFAPTPELADWEIQRYMAEQLDREEGERKLQDSKRLEHHTENPAGLHLVPKRPRPIAAYDPPNPRTPRPPRGPKK